MKDFLLALISADKVKKAFYALVLAVAVFAGGYFKVQIPGLTPEPVPVVEPAK